MTDLVGTEKAFVVVGAVDGELDRFFIVARSSVEHYQKARIGETVGTGDLRRKDVYFAVEDGGRTDVVARGESLAYEIHPVAVEFTIHRDIGERKAVFSFVCGGVDSCERACTGKKH